MTVVRSLVLGCFVVLAWIGLVGSAEEQSAAPVVVIETKSYDGGRINQGDVLKHEFRILNKGSAPLEIKQVKTD